ncbi:MAG: sugar phosphate isomerase/epimerase [FCB group bacterium]|nr:sugar phosphate isomerase/epimerase [FCB group bacterium]
MPAIPFALQLYSVRDHMNTDPVATLKAVKAAGYDHVEVVGRAGYPPRAFRQLLNDCGLTPVSAHVGLKDIEKDLRAICDSAHTLEIPYLVFSGDAPDRQGWLELAWQADEIGSLLRKEGLQLCYHNHAHEFARIDGEYPYDLLMANASPENLQAEIDVFWVRFAGLDPVEQIHKYGHRCPLLHIKDMTPEPPYTFTEVGRGIIDMPAVFRAGKEIGAQWYIVEQDESMRDSLESVRISADYMRQQTI